MKLKNLLLVDHVLEEVRDMRVRGGSASFLAVFEAAFEEIG